MAQVVVAREFFESHLPASLQEQLDFSTLKAEKDTFIDEAFKASEADLLYSVQLHNQSTAYLYLLCEHASTVDKNIAFRVLVYLVNIMKHHVAQHPDQPLPVIIPLVLYTGKPTWTAPLDIFPLFGEQEALARSVWPPAYQLVDIHRCSDDELKQRDFSGLIEYVFKNAQTRDVHKFLENAFPWLAQIAQKNSQQAILLGQNLVFYIAGINKHLDKTTFNQLAEQHLTATPLRSTMMTLAEQWKEEGRSEVMARAEQWKQEGRQEGEVLLLKALLIRRFGPLPAEYVARLESASSEQLMVWGEKILDARTLSDIFEQ